jgi:hypothetical protein
MAHAQVKSDKSNKFILKETLLKNIFQPAFEELGKIYNCNITCSTRFDKFDDNVIIEINQKKTNNRVTIINKNLADNTETIEFSLTKNNIKSIADKTDDCGYYTRYIIENNQIKNIYEYDVPPITTTRESADFSSGIITTFNPYKFINMILSSMGYKGSYINHNLTLEQILDTIKKIQIETITLDTYTREELKKHMEHTLQIFSNNDSKKKYDINLEKLIRYSEHHKATTLEQVDKHYKLQTLYNTNLPTINRTAFRLAQYYPYFPFTKSSISYPRKKKFITQEYIDVISKTLYGSFTVSDLYIHYFPEIRYTKDNLSFCKHNIYKNRFAYDIFELNKPENISHAFDLIELSKSIIFTFVSLTVKILTENKKILQNKDIAKKDNTFELLIPMHIFNVYPNLPWVNSFSDNNLILSKKLELQYRFYKSDGKIRYEQGINLNSDKSSISIDYLMPCHEAPFKFELFDGIISAPRETDKKQELKNQQIYQVDEIPVKSLSEGFEHYLLAEENAKTRLEKKMTIPIDKSLIRRINNMFFGETEPTTIDEHVEKKNIPDFDENIESDTAFPVMKPSPGILPNSEQQAILKKQREDEEKRRNVRAHAQQLRKVSADDETQKKPTGIVPIMYEDEEGGEGEEEDEYEEDEGIRTSFSTEIIRMNLKKLEQLLGQYIQKSIANKDIIKKNEEQLLKMDKMHDSTQKPIDKTKNPTNFYAKNAAKKLEKSIQPNIDDPEKIKLKLKEKIEENIELQTKINMIKNKLGMPIDQTEIDIQPQFKKSNASDRSKTKYLKYKAKYLALKQQYNL